MRAAPGADTRSMLMSEVENLAVESAETAARVIVNARTGTVVINSMVRLAPSAVTHGKLTVKIDEDQRISQPAPLSQGQTAVEQKSGVTVEQEVKPMFLLAPGPKLADVVKAISAIGASPADLVAILEALKEAGALKAELVIL
jgi:flagellar P-ring protein precursor FlgI